MAKGLRGRKRSARERTVERGGDTRAERDRRSERVYERGGEKERANDERRREKERRRERKEKNVSRGSGRGNQWIEKRSTMKME